MTQESYERLSRRKQTLESRREELGREAGEAAGAGHDWHDNAPYEAAVAELNMVTYQLHLVNEQLNTAEIISAVSQSEVVEIGTTVTIESDEEVESYFVGGEGDSNPAEGIISSRSPLGQALLGKRAGEKVKVITPGGRHSVTILSIGEAVSE